MGNSVIIHIPHASTLIPKDEGAKLSITGDDLKHELLLMTDRYTEDLFDISENTVKLLFPVSRLIVDPERFADDSKEPMADRGMGVIYTKTADGGALRPLPDAWERQRLLDT